MLNQVQGGKMARPKAQPQVTDVIARIKKGEFNGADYVLFGVVSSIDFTDALHPIQGTSNATRNTASATADPTSLINTKTYEIRPRSLPRVKATTPRSLHRSDIAPPNRARSSARRRKASRKTCTCNWPTSSVIPMPTSRAVCVHPSPWVPCWWCARQQPVPVPQQPEQVLIPSSGMGGVGRVAQTWA